ncbi:hypothetical protein Tco_0665220 [Tanacetum coccineum]
MDVCRSVWVVEKLIWILVVVVFKDEIVGPRHNEGFKDLGSWSKKHDCNNLSIDQVYVSNNAATTGGPPDDEQPINMRVGFRADGNHDQMLIEEECSMTLAALWTHMWILSVVRIEVFSLYGYDYMKKIILHRVNLKEYNIAERDFKYLYPSDFEDLYLLNLQGHLDYLPPEDKKILTTTVNLWTRNLVIRQRVEDFQLGIESYQMQLNLTKPQWDATGFEFKHDFTIIDSLRAITFRDKYEIDDALDYRVKEFKVNRMNPGLNTRFWTSKDVDRSKEFMFAIQKRLKTRRIYQNLESFVGGRIREGDYRLLKRTE